MRMNGVWAHAFLARTRLLDQEFLGRVLSAISRQTSSQLSIQSSFTICPDISNAIIVPS